VDFDAYSESRIKLIDEYIDVSLNRYRQTVSQRFSPLLEAMRYSLEGGGKRLRPLLVLASGEYLGLSLEKILPAACAVEYIHTYSLIHDDLPAIDDDDFRRGKPSNHKKFGEAVAILAGDTLLTEAFGQMLYLAEHGFTPQQIVGATELLVHTAGLRGMVGGQLLDVTTENHTYSLPEVEFIHIHKTGALIVCSVLLPTRLTNLEPGILSKLRRYGETIGLAFQISDDLLDSEAMIRYSRGPRKKPKPTYCQLMSPSEMRIKLNGLTEAAVQSVTPEGERSKSLVQIAEFIRTRKT
jgi:geranylgeranyl diphosphate synthase, type II